MIRYKKDTNNIVTLTMDMQGRQVNIINHEVAQAFVPVLKALQKEKERGGLRGVIITSAKKSFLTGGDLDYLHDNDSAEELFRYAQTLKEIYRELERPGVPVVAAINGSALGSGFELALACHHRIVEDRPEVRIGHPEVTLGMMPGNGGVIRLMWLLGIEKAFPILASGKRYRPKEALKAGIVDALASSRTDMMEKAVDWLLQNKEGRRAWDTEGGQIPGGTAYDAGMARKIQLMTAALVKETQGNYPAPKAILSTLSEGSKVDFDTACRIESRAYTSLLLQPETHNMTKAFWYDYNAIKSGINRPKGFGKFRPQKVGVIGAGRMGSGIACSCVVNGIKVVLKDVSKAIADRGKAYVTSQLNSLGERGRIRTSDVPDYLERVTTTEAAADFADCDIVIEAVFENENVKSKVTKEAEAYIDEYALFGTNTISIPVSDLAKHSIRPDNYVGLHFFAPVEQVPLVEVVRGENTSDETIARAFDFVRSIRKTPIIVKDFWGFYVSRVQNTYILEGIQMLQEGYAPALIENLGRQAGMPKGALAMADDLSLKMVLKYEEQAAKHYGSKYIQHPAVAILKEMIDKHERPGHSKGFYAYKQNKRTQLWPELSEHFGQEERTYDAEELKERFLFVQVIEAIWCLQEKIIDSIPEANLGSIHGWGFPAFKGGVIQFVEDYGRAQFIEKCQAYQKSHGPRFKVPKWLLSKSVAGTHS